ncbi:hypothetical protein ALP29_200276 [Pseudomonas syringae pv. avii]|uniref:Uncharacterized protein n=1 Tax=Pseudomonas syringae pv. avii TaxID=663959 RepID=A0A3M5UJH9_PSESX|nr:hypothetical protein ALP29_200276 [Pseudomonas syringae pv. avii]
MTGAVGQRQHLVTVFLITTPRRRCGAGHDQRTARLKERRIQGHAQPSVDQYAQGRTCSRQRRQFGIEPQLVRAHGQACLVGQHRIGTGQHHTRLGAQALNRRTRLGAGDPLAFTAGHGRSAIQAHGHLDPHIGPSGFHALDKTFVQRSRFAFQYAALNADTGSHQAQKPAAGHLRIGVLHCRNDPRQPGADQCIGARRGASLMAARFKCDVGGCAPGKLPGLAQRVHFGVRLASPRMPALTDNLAVTHDHATDSRVGVCRIKALARQFQRMGHVMNVEGCLFSQHCTQSLPGSRARRSISSRNSLRS